MAGVMTRREMLCQHHVMSDMLVRLWSREELDLRPRSQHG